jgi:hypothetical protein
LLLAAAGLAGLAVASTRSGSAAARGGAGAALLVARLVAVGAGSAGVLDGAGAWERVVASVVRLAGLRRRVVLVAEFLQQEI